MLTCRPAAAVVEPEQVEVAEVAAQLVGNCIVEPEGLLPDRGVQGGEPDNLLQVPAEPGPGIQNCRGESRIIYCRCRLSLGRVSRIVWRILVFWDARFHSVLHSFTRILIHENFKQK